MNLKTFKTKTPKEAVLGKEEKHVFSVPPKRNSPLSLQPNFFSSFPNQLSQIIHKSPFPMLHPSKPTTQTPNKSLTKRF
jgi:hypothetical protein